MCIVLDVLDAQAIQEQHITLLSGRRQINELHEIMHYAQCRIERKKIPSRAQVQESRIQKLMAQLKGVLEQDNRKYISLYQSLLGENHTAEDIACALFAWAMKENDTQEQISDEVFSSKRRQHTHERVDGQGRSFSHTQRTASRRRAGRKIEKENMVRLYLNIGRSSHVTPSHILGALTGETGLAGKSFGRIDIADRQTYVDVRREYAGKILARKNVSIMGQRIGVGRVK